MIVEYISSFLLIFLYQLAPTRHSIISQLSVDSTIFGFMLVVASHKHALAVTWPKDSIKPWWRTHYPRGQFFHHWLEQLRHNLGRTSVQFLAIKGSISFLNSEMEFVFLGWIERSPSLCPTCSVSSWELRILNTRYYILFGEPKLSETIHSPERVSISNPLTLQWHPDEKDFPFPSLSKQNLWQHQSSGLSWKKREDEPCCIYIIISTVEVLQS